MVLVLQNNHSPTEKDLNWMNNMNKVNDLVNKIKESELEKEKKKEESSKKEE